MSLEIKKYKVGETVLTYNRPQQVREIPRKVGSERGYMPSLKPNLRGKVWDYESLLEHDFYLLLDHDPGCLDFQPQPIEITFENKKRETEKVYPDCWAIFKDGKEYLFEVKPEKKLTKLEQDPNWERKIEAILTECRRLGWTFQIITERKIRSSRLEIVKDLVGVAKHWNRRHDLENKLDNILQHILGKEKRYSYGNLVSLLTGLLGFPKQDIIAALKYRIYYSHLYINWDNSLRHTEISLTLLQRLTPIYDLEEQEEVELHYPLTAETSSRTTNTRPYSVEEREVIDRKKAALSELIAKYGPNASRPQVYAYCRQNNRSTTLFTWYKAWVKEGDEGLRPGTKKKPHSKKRSDPTALALLKTHLEKWNHSKKSLQRFSLKRDRCPWQVLL